MTELSTEKTMNVKEVSEAIGYESDTIRKKMKELFPDSVVNGKETRLTEYQASVLKQHLTPRTLALKSEVERSSTDIEMKHKAAEVMAWLLRDNEQLKKQNETLQIENYEMQPKAESFDALQRSPETMSISNCAKHFGLHPKTEVLPYLRERGYLTLKDLPSQSAIDADILALIQNVVKKTNMAYPQAVVRASQLEAWRVRVVPNIKKWVAKQGYEKFLTSL